MLITLGLMPLFLFAQDTKTSIHNTSQCSLHSKQRTREVIMLQTVKADEAIQLLRKHITPCGTIQARTSSNTLIINDSPETIVLLKQMIHGLEKP